MSTNKHWTILPAILIALHALSCQSIATDNAAAHWSFDDKDIDDTKVIDSVGNYDGEIQRATQVVGRVGQALELAKPIDGITITDIGLIGKQQSVMLWFNKKADGMRRLIYFDGMYQVGFSGEEIFVHTGRDGKADTSMPFVNLDIPNDKWTHMAVTWDTAAQSDNVKVYINGQLRAKGTLDQARDKPLEINSFHIGHMADVDARNQTFIGTVDEVAIYNRTLSADEIAAYCKKVAQSTGKPTPPAVQREIISQLAAPPPLYFPKTTFSGDKKLLRLAGELISRMLYSNSIADADLPTKVKMWQNRGLDGLVFSITSHDRADPDKYWKMFGQWWALIPRTYEEFIPDIKAFQSVKDWGRITDNFLGSSYAVWGPAKGTRVQDWFNDDDWQIILNNVRIQARIAKECGFVGILFDTEQYKGHHAEGTWHIPFSYPNYAEDGYIKEGRTEPRSFDDVAAQIRKRGTQYTQALCEEFPGLKILVIAGLYEWTAREGDGPLAERHHGLYPAFLDGMLEGLDDQATIISGNEMTYNKTPYSYIGHERKRYDDAIDTLCNVSDALKSRMSFAAGIWVDPNRVWSDTDVSVNVRNPSDHHRAVRNAFIASDEYAWIYGQESHFLGESPTPLMHQYFKANEKAHDTWRSVNRDNLE